MSTTGKIFASFAIRNRALCVNLSGAQRSRRSHIRVITIKKTATSLELVTDVMLLFNFQIHKAAMPLNAHAGTWLKAHSSSHFNTQLFKRV